MNARRKRSGKLGIRTVLVLSVFGTALLCFWAYVALQILRPASDDAPAPLSENGRSVIFSALQRARAAESEGRLVEALNIYRDLLDTFPAYELPLTIRQKVADRITQLEKIIDALRQAREALDRDDLVAAQRLYQDLVTNYPSETLPEDITSTMKDISVRQARRADEMRILARVREAKAAHDRGEPDQARELLSRLTITERQLVTDAGFDVRALEAAIDQALQSRQTQQLRAQARQEVLRLLAAGQQQMKSKNFKAAEATYVRIKDTYSPDDLPAGTDLAALIDQARRVGETVGPPRSPEKIKADELWSEVLRLQGQKKYNEAIKKCEEIQALPAKVHPTDLKARIDLLKQKAEEQRKLDFFGIDSSSTAP